MSTRYKMARGLTDNLHVARRKAGAEWESGEESWEPGMPPESEALGARFRSSCVVVGYPDRHLVEEAEVDETLGPNEVSMGDPQAHDPSS